VHNCGRAIAAVALAILMTAFAASASETIYLATYTFDPAAGEPAIDSWLRAGTPTEGAASYYLVQLAGPSTEARKATVGALGGELIAYVPDNTWITRIDGGRAASLTESPDVAWVGAFHPAYKISPTIGTHEFKNPKRAGDSFLTLYIRVFEDLDGTARELEALGVEVLETSDDGFQKIIVAHASQPMVNAIARVPSVWWIEEKPEFTVLNDTTKWVVQSNINGSTPIWDQGIHGEGQLVAVMDSGLDYNSCWFRETGGAAPGPSHRKVVDYTPYGGGQPYDGCDIGHGTHVCGTLAGDQSYINPGNYNYNGMAYKAKLMMQDVGADDEWGCTIGEVQIPTSLTSAYTNAYSSGARIHSNSWGGTDNTYDSYCVDIDNFMWNNQQFLVVFAAGNAGPGASTVGFPGTAKNCITVGATRRPPDQDVMAGYSSRGPAFDGRMKPTVTAPGGEAGYSYINSVDNDTGNPPAQTCSMVSDPFQGTSMATPAVAGVAALTRQYFEDGWFPYGTPTAGEERTPSAALVKAVVMNSATDMATPDIPNSNEGWGRVLLNDALYFDGDAIELKIADEGTGVTNGGTASYSFDVDSATVPLEVTLVWTDYPATSGAGVALINNLDLTVTAPGGVDYKGNVFSGGVSTPAGSYDIRNVEEVVRLAAPAVGTYTVRVDGTSVPHAPQPFAIAATGSFSNWPPQSGIEDEPASHGRKFEIEGISPNPFNPTAKIVYQLYPVGTGQAHVKLRVLSVDGRVVRTLVDRVQDPARYEVIWDGTDDAGNIVASGIYFCDLSYGGDRDTRKMTLLK
jgi:hypothetical protein